MHTWDYMGLYGTVWDFVNFYGILVGLMMELVGFKEILRDDYMEPCGILWDSMKFHGMAIHGTIWIYRWDSMGF